MEPRRAWAEMALIGAAVATGAGGGAAAAAEFTVAAAVAATLGTIVTGISGGPFGDTRMDREACGSIGGRGAGAEEEGAAAAGAAFDAAPEAAAAAATAEGSMPGAPATIGIDPRLCTPNGDAAPPAPRGDNAA